MTEKDKMYLKVGLAFVGLASLVGVSLIIIEQDIRTPSTSFELLVFFMSSIALILAILQSIVAQRQMRAIKRASIKISQTAKELELLIGAERRQNSILNRDLELDKMLVESLAKKNLEKRPSSKLGKLRKKFQSIKESE